MLEIIQRFCVAELVVGILLGFRPMKYLLLAVFGTFAVIRWMKSNGTQAVTHE
jgi:hypothetical protein